MIQNIFFIFIHRGRQPQIILFKRRQTSVSLKVGGDVTNHDEFLEK